MTRPSASYVADVLAALALVAGLFLWFLVAALWQ